MALVPINEGFILLIRHIVIKQFVFKFLQKYMYIRIQHRRAWGVTIFYNYLGPLICLRPLRQYLDLYVLLIFSEHFFASVNLKCIKCIIKNEPTWRCCEPTCLSLESFFDLDLPTLCRVIGKHFFLHMLTLTFALEPCDLWPWPFWPLTSRPQIKHTMLSPSKSRFFLTWWLWPLT